MQKRSNLKAKAKAAAKARVKVKVAKFEGSEVTFLKLKMVVAVSFLLLLCFFYSMKRAWGEAGFDDCKQRFDRGGKWYTTGIDMGAVGTQIESFQNRFCEKLKENPLQKPAGATPEQLAQAKKKCQTTVQGLFDSHVRMVIQSYDLAQACIAINNLSKVKNAEDAPSGETHTPKSGQMMMMAGMGGMMGGGMAGGAMGGAGGMMPPSMGMGSNPMMMSMMASGMTCKASGPETQDYFSCKALVNAFDGFMMTQMVTQQGEQMYTQFQAAKAQNEVLLAQGKQPDLQFVKMQEQMQAMMGVALGRASMEAAKAAAFGGLAMAMPTKATLISGCEEGFRKAKNLDSIRNKLKSVLNAMRNYATEHCEGGVTCQGEAAAADPLTPPNASSNRPGDEPQGSVPAVAPVGASAPGGVHLQEASSGRPPSRSGASDNSDSASVPGHAGSNVLDFGPVKSTSEKWSPDGSYSKRTYYNDQKGGAAPPTEGKK
ncbi:MAG: hypothetical protein HQK52_14955 [Oligoflexia bacterium]|nr:hypothetical protein [Oligoflexia bacterium]